MQTDQVAQCSPKLVPDTTAAGRRPQPRADARSLDRAVGMAEKRPIAAFEKNSKPVRRRCCVDFDFEDFSGLRGSDERDRTTAEWDWLPDAAAGSTSLWNWESERVP